MEKYEKELAVPYSFLFEPEAKEMTLSRMNDAGRYVSVVPDDAGRVGIPEPELEIGTVEEWVRDWFRGALLELPVELTHRMGALREELRAANQRLGDAETEIARLRAGLEALEGAR